MLIKLKDGDSNTVCRTKIVLKTDKVLVESSVNIIFYSKILLSLNKKTQRRFIEDIYTLDELNDWYENHYVNSKAYNKCNGFQQVYDKVTREIKSMYDDVASKYGLLINDNGIYKTGLYVKDNGGLK